MAGSMIDTLTTGFSQEHAERWLRGTFASFSGDGLRLDVKGASFDRAGVTEAKRLGYVVLARATDDAHQVELPVFLVRMARMGMGPQRRAQFACAKQILKGWGNGRGERDVPGALFFFHAQGRTRLSLVTPRDQAATDYKRQSFLLVPEEKGRVRNQTFRKYFDGSRVTCFGRPGEKARGGARSLLARFSVEALTKAFYTELFAWYEWAADPKTGVRFPDAAGDLAKTKEHLIRLITRLMFVWFVRERGLVPDELFDAKWLGETLLRDFDPDDEEEGNYYNAILQNLFFATLNQPVEERRFTDERSYHGKNASYGVNTLFRDKEVHGGGHSASWFLPSHDGVLRAFASVPYLNGGLFECLDGEDENDGNRKVYRDGFSRRADKRALLPNVLFFDAKRGLLPLLKRYDFTIDENHATDADIALDPELLGKVFENLLASYDPQTGKTARKASGSFYTPREIVDYMVDQSLRAALDPVTDAKTLDVLFGEDAEAITNLSAATKAKIRERLRDLKTIDPACGSGAFPMGLLNRVVELLGDLGDEEDVYHRKLHLMENGIYGVDIQPIAAQISKLRFFISLLCDQKICKDAPNAGLDQLPNLEFHLVIANTLIPLAGANLLAENDVTVKRLRAEIFALQAAYGRAHRRQEKVEIIKKEHNCREALTKRYDELGFGYEAAQFDKWEPHNPGVASPFFDAEKMFGIAHFDIVIGNPPYVQVEAKDPLNVKYGQLYSCAKGGKKNLYRLFFERGFQFVKDGGCLSYITPNTFLSGTASAALRHYFFKHITILSLLGYSEKERVFENVTQAVVVSVMLKQRADKAHVVCIRTERQGYVSAKQRDLEAQGDLIPRDIAITRVSSLPFKLSDFLEGYQGEINVATKADQYSTIQRPSALPMWRGAHIGRFVSIMMPTEYCERAATSRLHWKLRRIVLQERSNQSQLYRIKACVSDVGFMCGHTTNYLFNKDMTREEELYWLGILNSRLFNYVASFSNQTNDVPIKALLETPVPRPTDANIALLAPIVKAIVERKTEDYESDTTELEERLNQAVYRLYGLTAEEIALVERSFERSEKRSDAAEQRVSAGADEDDEDDEEA